MVVIQGLTENFMCQQLSFTTCIYMHYLFTAQLVSAYFDQSGYHLYCFSVLMISFVLLFANSTRIFNCGSWGIRNEHHDIKLAMTVTDLPLKIKSKNCFGNNGSLISGKGRQSQTFCVCLLCHCAFFSMFHLCVFNIMPCKMS